MTINEASDTIGGQRRGSFDYRTKDDHLDAWEDHYNTTIVIVSMLGKKRGTLAGKKSLTSIMTRYPQSMGHALFEDSDMPAPYHGGGFKPELFTRYMFGRMRWTWAVEAMARAGKKGVWKAPRAEDMRTGRIQFELNGARIWYLGVAQPLATITALTDSDTFTIGGRDARTEGANFRWMFAEHYLRKGMPVTNIDDTAGSDVEYLGRIPAANTNMRRVDSIDVSDYSAVVLDLDGDLDTVPEVNHIIVPWNSRRNTDATDDDAFDSDLAAHNGLLNMSVDDTYKAFYLNTNRDTEPSLSSIVMNGTPAGTLRNWNENLIELGVDLSTTDERSTGDDMTVILAEPAMRRLYVNEVKGLRMFGETITKRGYGPKLQHTAGDMPLTWKTDRDCPPGLTWVLDPSAYGWYSESDFQFVDEGERFVENKAAHEIVVVRSGNAVNRRPRTTVLIGDVNFRTRSLMP